MTIAVRWPEHERIERHRIEQASPLYCPVCRRPTPQEVGPVATARRLAEHLVEVHDPIWPALLRIHLSAASERSAAEPAAEAFYPAGDAW